MRPCGRIVAAWKYRVEVSKGEPNFSQLYDSAETEQACWAPTRGYGDLTGYYWHVAMKDGNNRQGSFSPARTFSKQYPAPTLISPIGGRPIAETPTFQRAPAEGAAQYRLEASQDKDFGVLYDSVTTNSTHYTPVKTYKLGWRY